MDEKKLTHIDSNGKARMVDVGDKEITSRSAIATGEVLMSIATLDLLKSGVNKKGDYQSVSRVAGIFAAKKTSELIPLCHPLNINKVDIDLEIDDQLPGVRIKSTVSVDGKTGVEMEALMAVSICALTIYDMVKAIDKKMVIQNVRLVEKKGGKSGYFSNP